VLSAVVLMVWLAYPESYIEDVWTCEGSIAAVVNEQSGKTLNRPFLRPFPSFLPSPKLCFRHRMLKC
jgi:hypothetical protein